MRLNQEEGWGPYKFCVGCTSTKQTLDVKYFDIVAQQVRNCATSLILKPAWTQVQYASIDNIKLSSNLTLSYSQSNQTLTNGYTDIFTSID